MHLSFWTLDNVDISAKAEPFSVLHEDTEHSSNSYASEADVTFSVNDTVIKTAEVFDTETFESILATGSNLPEVELPEHVNVSFLQTINECNLTIDVERDLKQLLLTIFIHRNIKPVANKKKRKENLN